MFCLNSNHDKILRSLYSMNSLKYIENDLLPPIHTYNLCTIFFLDIVNFSKKCKLLTSEKVAEWMTNFHNIIQKYIKKYYIQKIETKGDNYLCLSGTNHIDNDLVINQVTRMVNFSNKIIKKLNNLDNTNVRIGIHCGSTTISYIGHNAPLKTVYGNDVNIAARMEQSSKTNLIHLTKKAAEIYANENNLLLDNSKCYVTNIKDIINMETFFYDAYIKDFISIK